MTFRDLVIQMKISKELLITSTVLRFQTTNSKYSSLATFQNQTTQ